VDGLKVVRRRVPLAARLSAKDGGAPGTSVLEKRVTEIAEKKVALEARARDLGRSNEDPEQFAYAASHDLQEPLRAKAGRVQALQRKYNGKLDEKGDELIGMIVDGSTRMKALPEFRI
jgi:light-regulated signal transduction histidine kinase (bacteriophytochrome)